MSHIPGTEMYIMSHFLDMDMKSRNQTIDVFKVKLVITDLVIMIILIAL